MLDESLVRILMSSTWLLASRMACSVSLDSNVSVWFAMSQSGLSICAIDPVAPAKLNRSAQHRPKEA